MKKLIVLLVIAVIGIASSAFVAEENSSERSSEGIQIGYIRAGDNSINYGSITTATPDVTVWAICPRVAGGGSPVQVTAVVDGRTYTATIPSTTTGTSKYTFMASTEGHQGSYYNWSFEFRATQVYNPTDISIYALSAGN